MADPLVKEQMYYNVVQPLSQSGPSAAMPLAPDTGPDLSALAVTRFRFAAVLDRPMQWPSHAGALLRSVFGAALRQGVCSTGLPHCAECPLLRSCAYPAVFETPPQATQFAQRFSQPPNPYVIEPPPGLQGTQPAGPLVFEMVLVGEALQRQLALVVGAWQRALRSGLGQARVTGKLLAVDAVDAAGVCRSAFDLGMHKPAPSLPVIDIRSLHLSGPNTSNGVMLQFDTPLRLQHESQPLQAQQLTPRIFMGHLLRRTNLMLDLHLGIRPAPFDVRALLTVADGLADNRNRLQWHEMRRYSARQRQEMPQSGVVGQWHWHGQMAPLVPWLLLGQWLHLGKGATSGLGGYRVLPLEAAGEL